MSGSNNPTPRSLGVLVRDDAWCPMAYGEGTSCSCNPTIELIEDIEAFAGIVQRDLRNRAQRRADAKAARKGEA